MKKNLKKAIILSLLLTCSYHQQSWADELGTIKYSGGGIENIGDGHTITTIWTLVQLLMGVVLTLVI